MVEYILRYRGCALSLFIAIFTVLQYERHHLSRDYTPLFNQTATIEARAVNSHIQFEELLAKDPP